MIVRNYQKIHNIIALLKKIQLRDHHRRIAVEVKIQLHSTDLLAQSVSLINDEHEAKMREEKVVLFFCKQRNGVSFVFALPFEK